MAVAPRRGPATIAALWGHFGNLTEATYMAPLRHTLLPEQSRQRTRILWHLMPLIALGHTRISTLRGMRNVDFP